VALGSAPSSYRPRSRVMPPFSSSSRQSDTV
jgi:hypothetical protein